MTLSLLSWVRATPREGATAAGARASLPLQVAVNGTSIDKPIRLDMIGPGDVVGIDASQVIRTDPPPDSTGFECTRWPCVEFDHPALPWLLSAWPAAGQTLFPWLCLLVVRQQPGADLAPGPLPGSTILNVAAAAAAELPDPAAAALWAHAQIAGTLDAADHIDRIDHDTPERTLSRLLCPVTLQPNQTYRACVVPSTETGRRAGLGLDPGSTGPAPWTTTVTLTLPVYYEWQFGTGEDGDFHRIAAGLTGRDLPQLGRDTIDLTDVGGAADLPTGGVLQGLHTPALPDQGTTVRAALATALTGSATAAPARLTQPTYGARYAPDPVVIADGHGWLAELNLDPRWRIAAALGAAVVQTEQEDLVAAAWDQAGDVLEVNAALNRAALARAVTSNQIATHLAPLDDGTLVTVTAPCHARVVAGGATIRSRLGDDRARALVSPPYRRLLSRQHLPPAAQADPDSVDPHTGPSANGQPIALSMSPAPFDIDPHLPVALRAALQPELTIPARALARVRRPTAATPDTAHPAAMVGPTTNPGGVDADLLAPSVAAPSFPAPTAPALAALAPAAFLPGGGDIPAETVTLAETNPAFVAAFMIGLNTEVGRELQWRGFPLDTSATPFRWFWDFRGQSSAISDLSALTGLDPARSLDSLVSQPADVVLVLRSDLLRRYPNTLVYALPATANGTEPDLSATPTTPAFTGGLGADLRYFGFALTAGQATGSAGGSGWWFAFQEQLTQVRFGPTDPAASAASAAQFAHDHLRPAERVVLPASRWRLP